MEGATAMGRPSIKMNQPWVLPEEGLTSIGFKRWRTWLINYLDQDLEFGQFLTGERYETWEAANSSPRGLKGRITNLFVKDADSPPHLRGDDFKDEQVEASAIKIDPSMVGGQNSYARMTAEAKRDLKDDLVLRRLDSRNRSLNKMLQVLSSFVHDNEAEDVVHASISLSWIWHYLQARYNIESQGVNFLKIVKHNFKSGDNPQTFYKQFRSSFVDNLRKRGDSRNHLKPGDIMPADETMGPSQEDTVVLWTLEKIDPRLPAMVARNYEHRLDKTTHLIDLATTIFQQVPAMLEALNREAGLAAMVSSAAILPYEPLQEENPTLNAFFPRGRGGGGRGGGARGGSSRGNQPRISPVTGRPWTVKMCRLCEDKKKSPAVVASHNTAECDSLSKSDKRAMLAALQAMDLSTTNDDDFSEMMGPNGEPAGQDGLAQGLPSSSS